MIKGESQMSTKDAIRRSMLWAAYGDALGFITEMRNKSSLSIRTGNNDRITGLVPWVRRVGGEFGVNVKLPAGCYSDDTQLRLATCRSIMGNGCFDVETFSKIEIPVWLSYSLGAGVASKIAAESLKKRSILWNSNFYKSKYAQYINSGGNGAAMRIQPHIWCAPEDKGNYEILKDVIRNTITTHGHSRAIVGAAFHALNLRKAILTRNIPYPDDWLSILEELIKIPAVIHADEDLLTYWLPNWEKESQKTIEEAICQSVDELYNDIKMAQKSLETSEGYPKTGNEYAQLVEKFGCLEKQFVGSAPKTALLASYLSHTYHDKPLDGLVEAVNLLGSDTDTIATMAGAFMGIIANSDPPEEVADIEYIEKEAERLFELSERRRTASFVYPDMLYWQPPHTQTDIIGQYEGNWALQGLGNAEPVGTPYERKGKYPVIWQWFRLNFGQTVLIKRRQEIKTLTKNSLPIELTTTESEKDQIHRQAKLWDNQRLVDISKQQEISLDLATDICIDSGFREDIVGSMLMNFAVQEKGIEKAIAFASLIAKAKHARMKKEGSSKSINKLQLPILSFLHKWEQDKHRMVLLKDLAHAKPIADELAVPLDIIGEVVKILESNGLIEVFRTVRDMDNPALRLTRKGLKKLQENIT